jgi:amino acid transporter
MQQAEETGPGYERLGGRRLSLIDVVAQSVGFMGPVFSAAFIIPLIAGILSATGKGAGITSPLAVLIAAVGVFALGWIVAQYARRIHAAGSLYAYVSQGLGERAGGYGSTWIVRLLEFVVLLDMLAVAVGASVASTRGLFAMARDRRIPAPLAAVSRRRGTPVGAIEFLMLFTVLLIAADEWWTGLFALPNTPHYFSLFSWYSTFGAFALIVVYLLLSVGALRGLLDGPNRAGVALAALAGIALSGGAIFGSIYKVTRPTVLAPWYALAWFAVGIVVTLAVRGRAPASRVLSDLSSAPTSATAE